MSYDLGRSGGVESTRTIGLRRFHPVSPSDLTCMHGNFVSGRISGGCRQKIRWNVRSARTVVVGRTRGGGNFCEVRRGRLPIGAVGTSLHRPSHTLVKLVCTSTYLPLPCWGTRRLRKFQTDEVELLGQRVLLVHWWDESTSRTASCQPAAHDGSSYVVGVSPLSS